MFCTFQVNFFFESGDAFCVTDQNELIVFQITVAEHHPVKMNGLTKICDLFSDLAISSHHLVFVVPSRPQLQMQQQITPSKDVNKAREVREFESNQWLFIYCLPVPPC